jgi:hypothetical protein
MVDMNDPDDQTVGRFLEAIGLEANYETREQLMIMMEALTVYQQREAQYAGAWKEFGALNNLVRLATKCKRLVNKYWTKSISDLMGQDVDFDDAIDAINYAVFFVRQGRMGQWRSDGR